MDIPRGHAAMPLTEADFLDFIYNYYKAEYAPIRSFWSTATADPRQMSRFINMGHELSPLSCRAANAQAQKDLESLDFLTRKWNLDPSFVKGLVIRFAKYEVHDRLEKKLFECARLDLMVRKALKEKHLIDALWPSPAPRTISHDLLQQGVQIRKWYGDMFNKYFRVLRSIDEFELRPEVDLRIKNSGTLMLVPFVDHLIFGAVDPIMPIVAKGAGYSNVKGWDKREGSSKSDGYGEPGKFEIRFDAPADAQDTYTKTVVRQCQCNKCGTKRDVQVVVSVDPNPNGGAVAGSASTRKPSASGASGQRRQTSKTAQRYAAGYNMPGSQDTAPRQPPRPQPQVEAPARAATPDRKKQCPRCTFLNHAELTACEMCQADLPDATIQKPPSPVTVKVSHSHSASHPPPSKPEPRADNSLSAERPAGPSRHSLSASLFSIFPFSQQQQQEHHAKIPPTQQTDMPSVARQQKKEDPTPEQPSSSKHEPAPKAGPSSSRHAAEPPNESTPPNLIDAEPDREAPLSRAPEMAMMPLTPSPATSKRPAPAGLPSNLMDEFVPVSPAFPTKEEEEDAGWGEMSREEVDGSDSDEEEYEGRTSGGLVDLDAVAREEADVWGEREDED
ncbi:hypothetical protein CC86DRAFT_371800 [Ophiobolus disseminans]|uniref:RanBP2-type domain-containing protein n=1 Tax=Ophiobolus disseminans TaxID=1469910 RepID=A0A6A6ZVT6_9PLEO|nr:hypothetical protein CC86DRAFT_371800 [Ophiobolus disseminans]